MINKKAILTIMVLTITSSVFTGCGAEDDISSKSKKELVQMYTELETKYYALGAEYDEYKSLTTGIQSETEVTSAISITGDGTGRFTFNSVDSKIIFPVTFQYPGSTAAPGDGVVNIVSGVNISPTANWICKLNGTTLELENPDSGVSGTIKIGKQEYVYDVEALKADVIEPWFAQLPPAQVNYSNVYVDSQPFGVQATTPTTIDSEDAFLRCGMVASSSGYCITYVFVYRGTSDSSKNESIQNLLNSITIGGSKLLVEIS